MRMAKADTGTKSAPLLKGRHERKTGALKGHEVMLARIEAVRLAQRSEGNFDCFARAKSGFCDQGECLYRSDCLAYSQRMA